jgi:uncharacterized membrane protein
MSDEPQGTPEDGVGALGGRSLPLNRFNAFSDGVFAIAITLLALELAVPPAGVALWPALRGQWPEFVGFYISFAFIGGIWITHSSMTKYMRRGDTAAFALDLVLLFFVCLLPFFTALMVTHLDGADAELATVLYGINSLFASLSLSALILYLARVPALLVDVLDEDVLRRATRRRWAAIGLNVVAIATALVYPLAAAILYLVVSTTLLVIPLLGVRRHLHRRHAA